MRSFGEKGRRPPRTLATTHYELKELVAKICKKVGINKF